jgi:hypothetical protein
MSCSMASPILWSFFVACSLVLGYSNPRAVPIPEDYDVLQYVDPLIGSANGGTLSRLITVVILSLASDHLFP